MKKLIFILPLLLLLSCTTSKRMSFLTFPSESISAYSNINLDEYEQKYGEYDGVYLNIENTIEHSGSKENLGVFNKWVFTRVWKKKYIILNPDAVWLTTFSVYSKPDQLYIRISSPNGKVQHFGNTDLKEEKDFSGYNNYRLIFPDIIKGSIVEIGYENSFSVGMFPPPLEHDIQLQFRIPCEEFTFSYLYPMWWEIQKKMIQKGKMSPGEIIEDPENKKSILEYSAKVIPPLRWEPYSPEFKKVALYLQFMVTDLKMGRGYMDRPKNWQDLADKFYDYMLKKSDHKKISLKTGTAPLVEKSIYSLKELVDLIIEGKTDDMDKLDAMVSYIQDNIELTYDSYDGNNSKILKSKKGNKYDITALAKNMFEEAGLEVSYLLVHSAEDGYYDKYYIARDQFYIPAIRTITSDDTLVIFPYINDLPLDHTPSYFQGEPSIVINKKAPIKFWTLPKGNRMENIDSGDYQISISEDGIIDVVEYKALKGVLAFAAREMLSDLNDEETKKIMKDLVTYSDGDIEWVSYDIQNLDKHRENLILEMRYKINNLVMITPDEIVMQTAGLFSPISNKKYKLDPKSRQNPISISYNQQFTKHIVITYPKQWQFSTELEDMSKSNIFGEVSKTHMFAEGEITIDQNLIIKQTETDRKKYPLLLELTGDDNSVIVPALIFEIKNI